MTAGASSVSDAEYSEILRFLYTEASLLDQRRFADWLRLLGEGLKYRVAVCVVRDGGLANVEHAIIDEDIAGLTSRVEQVSNPRLTRAENPASLTRRFVSNVQASRLEPGYLVESNLLIYRARSALPQGSFYVGERRDLLVRLDGELRLARRDVRLD
ncbi:MAG TPA: aromatic-ring-hydroxylating dioxygenase subunit beta, partial [Burkholderiales bacterium]|nr:aromatic-ring-hydroxylating dioxygenase subunit beta [Burkholderiales bacterium]